MPETRPNLVLLDESDSGQVMVTTRDGDKFLVAMTDAVRACRAFDKSQEFVAQYNGLLDALTEWLNAHRESVRSAHLTTRERDILFVVVQKRVDFDQTLMDDLVDLDVRIAGDASLNLIALDVLAIPLVSPTAMNAFMPTGESSANAE